MESVPDDLAEIVAVAARWEPDAVGVLRDAIYDHSLQDDAVDAFAGRVCRDTIEHVAGGEGIGVGVPVYCDRAAGRESLLTSGLRTGHRDGAGYGDRRDVYGCAGSRLAVGRGRGSHVRDVARAWVRHRERLDDPADISSCHDGCRVAVTARDGEDVPDLIAGASCGQGRGTDGACYRCRRACQ